MSPEGGSSEVSTDLYLSLSGWWMSHYGFAMWKTINENSQPDGGRDESVETLLEPIPVTKKVHIWESILKNNETSYYIHENLRSNMYKTELIIVFIKLKERKATWSRPAPCVQVELKSVQE